jgi:hypothetical protein
MSNGLQDNLSFIVIAGILLLGLLLLVMVLTMLQVVLVLLLDFNRSIATGCGLDGRGSIPGSSKRFFLLHTWHWGSHSLLFSGSVGIFLWGKTAGA